MEKSYNNLVVMGDPIIDFYINSNQNVYDQRNGGALNVFMNARQLKSINTFFFPSESELLLAKQNPLLNENLKPNIIYNPIYYYILRINNEQDLPFSEPELKTSFYKWVFSQRKYDILNYSIDLESSTLVLSDYNKGTLNKNPFFEKINNQFKLCVVDTRYRSINLEYLKLSKLNIWRCTGSEYDKDFAINFDYTIWTNAEAPVKILNKSQECLAVINFNPVPKDKVKDTCGAGDTFTASFAAYLSCLEQRPTVQNLKDACHFSLECCQEVIQLNRTSITTKKINIQ